VEKVRGRDGEVPNRETDELTMHEFEQFVDDRLEELPMRSQEARILSDHVHNVGRDDRLIVLALLLLAEPQKVLDDGDKESFLVLFLHRSGDTSNRPAKLKKLFILIR